MPEPINTALLCAVATQESVVALYMSMRHLSSTEFSSERKQLKDMLGDLRILQARIEKRKDDGERT